MRENPALLLQMLTLVWDHKDLQFLHTLNGTGLVAVMLGCPSPPSGSGFFQADNEERQW